jgi:hypothetical protein
MLLLFVQDKSHVRYYHCNILASKCAKQQALEGRAFSMHWCEGKNAAPSDFYARTNAYWKLRAKKDFVC